MSRFYSASAKVPESPYTPEIFDLGDPKRGLSDPNKVNAGRPTVLSLGPMGKFGDWTDPKQAYLIQKGPRPFASTYDRVAGGTSHWLGTCLRFVPNDFKMKSQYGQLADWPIGYNDLNSWYGEAEKELGFPRMSTSRNLAVSNFRPATHIRCPRFQIQPRTSTSTTPSTRIH
jgi:glucose dehydrogenase